MDSALGVGATGGSIGAVIKIAGEKAETGSSSYVSNCLPLLYSYENQKRNDFLNKDILRDVNLEYLRFCEVICYVVFCFGAGLGPQGLLAVSSLTPGMK